MIKQKGYKFRLYPNLEQKIFFEKTFGCSRFIWNQMLADRIAHYKETGEFLKNTPAQYKSQFPWLKEVDSLALAKHINLFFNQRLVFLILNLKKQFNPIRLTTKKERLLF